MNTAAVWTGHPVPPPLPAAGTHEAYPVGGQLLLAELVASFGQPRAGALFAALTGPDRAVPSPRRSGPPLPAR